MGADGHLAAAVETGEKAALGLHADARLVVLEPFDEPEHAFVIPAALDAESTLADSRDKLLRIEGRHVRGREAETHEAGGSQQNGVEPAFPEPFKARVHVAPEANNLKVGAHGQKLGLAAKAACAHAGSLRELVRRGIFLGAQAVRENLALRDAP